GACPSSCRKTRGGFQTLVQNRLRRKRCFTRDEILDDSHWPREPWESHRRKCSRRQNRIRRLRVSKSARSPIATAACRIRARKPTFSTSSIPGSAQSNSRLRWVTGRGKKGIGIPVRRLPLLQQQVADAAVVSAGAADVV